jgi:hypothetical protein
MPLALSDNQLRIVMAAAGGLPPEKRAVLLERIAAQLSRVRRPGDEDVERAARLALQGLMHRAGSLGFGIVTLPTLL